MSTTSPWASLKQRTAGKWQLPLLIVSVLLLAGSLLRLRPSPAQFPLDKAVEYLDALIAGGWYDRAAGLAEALLNRKGEGEAGLGAVYLRLARARYGQAETRDLRTVEVGAEIVADYTRAAEDAQALKAEDFRRLGEAYEWQSQYARAVAEFSSALREGVDRPLELRRHMLSLLWDHPEAQGGTPAEPLRERLAQLREDAVPQRLDAAFWATEKELELLHSLGRLDEAAALLEEHRDLFEETDFADQFAYREAWLLFQEGDYAEAERRLRTLRNRVERHEHVYAMSGWLLGRVVMQDSDPVRLNEALAFFESVIRFYAATPYGVASRIGAAEALGRLDRHKEALEAYRVALDELEELDDASPVDRAALRVSLAVAAEAQRQAGRLKEAVEYAGLAAQLIEPANLEQATAFLHQLAQLQKQYAIELERAEDSTPRRTAQAQSLRLAVFADAASTYLQVARLNAVNDRLAAESSWQAADLFARAGQEERAIELFRAFVTERPHDALVPRALMRIGDLYRQLGNLSAAAAAYRSCYRRYPRTLEGARSLVPLAGCYLAMGPDHEDLAEKTLRIVLEGSAIFTPQAPEFADALFLLGDVLNRRGEYGRAIAALEEALERYPDHTRGPAGRFLLAESYRKSALSLKARMAEAQSSSDLEQMRVEAAARFTRAREIYGELIEAYESRDTSQLGALAQMHVQHAYFYEADCCFETQDYRRALTLYERAAGRYRDTPRALAGYIQIFNCYVFLNQPEEARAALARAMVLVDAVPNEAFQRSVSPETREDWKRYFQWLRQADLF